MAIYLLADILQPMISRLCEEKGRTEEHGRYLWWFPRITRPNMYSKNQYWEMREWVIDYRRQYPTFQLPFFILVTDTCQKSYIPGKLRTVFCLLKNN